MIEKEIEQDATLCWSFSYLPPENNQKEEKKEVEVERIDFDQIVKDIELENDNNLKLP